MRASFRYAARQDWDRISHALKPIYTAPTAKAAEDRFLEFQEEWGAKYPAIVRLWSNAWAEFVPFLQFDAEIRRIVRTTNTIESVNARIRKAVHARQHFPNEATASKCLYMAAMSLDPTGAGHKRWTMRWKPPLQALDIAYRRPTLRRPPATHTTPVTPPAVQTQSQSHHLTTLTTLRHQPAPIRIPHAQWSTATTSRLSSQHHDPSP